MLKRMARFERLWRRQWGERLARLAALLAEGLRDDGMTERSISHGSFTVKRTYPHPPAKVFRYFSDPDLKRRWYGGPNQDDARRIFEFKVGGRETNFGRVGNLSFELESVYYDIVPDNRIIHVYDVRIDGVMHSLSMAAVELRPENDGTTVVITERGAFLDGHENPAERSAGTEWVLDQLGKILAEDIDGESK